MAIDTIARRSRLPFHWRADLGLVHGSDLGWKLRGMNGEVGTFTRAGAGRALAANGYLHTVADNQPRTEWVLQSGVYVPHTLLEDAGTNLCLQSEDFGVTWVPSGTPTRVAAAHTASGVTLDLIGDDNAAAAEFYQQPITFTGNATKAVSICLKRGPSASANGSDIRIQDSTAPADRLLGNVAFDANGVPTVTMTTGTHLLTRAMADGVYRFFFQTTSVTAANTHNIQVCSTRRTIAADTGNVYAGGVQVEDSPFPTSYVKTTTGTVTRATDSLYFPFPMLPQAMTVYCKFTEMGTAGLGTAARLWSINSAAGGNPRAIVYGSANQYTAHHNNGSAPVESATAATIAMGQLGEHRYVLSATGTVRPHLSVNGGAEVSGAESAANALAGAWSDTRLYINSSGTASVGFNAFQCVKVLPGVRTMAECRSAW